MQSAERYIPNFTGGGNFSHAIDSVEQSTLTPSLFNIISIIIIIKQKITTTQPHIHYVRLMAFFPGQP